MFDLGTPGGGLQGSETLVFADRMLFLTGRKPGFGEEEASAMRAQFSAQGVLPKVDALSRDEAEAALTRFQASSPPRRARKRRYLQR